jgi:hypothetical protein
MSGNSGLRLEVVVPDPAAHGFFEFCIEEKEKQIRCLIQNEDIPRPGAGNGVRTIFCFK